MALGQNEGDLRKTFEKQRILYYNINCIKIYKKE
jgi:hypothetical protein